MKKLLPYILMFVVIVNLFAPFSVTNKLNRKIKIQENKVYAEPGQWYYLVYMKSTPNGNKPGLFDSKELCDAHRTTFMESDGFKNNFKTDGSGEYTSYPSECIQEIEEQTMVDVWMFEVTDTNGGVIEKSDYFEGNNNISADKQCENARDLYITELGDNPENVTVGECKKVSIQQTVAETVRKYKENNPDPMPLCVFAHPIKGTFVGCIAQMFYYVLFVPTSYVFALAGQFFDFTFNYSVQDTSYRTPFVVQGWGIVRDMCNMFFIFILLYIAVGTILNLHSVKTKEMVINVVIIGLLINFSLFATQILIDTSNILARVFYNSDTIKITQKEGGANGVTKATPGLKIGPNGEIPLSAAIVNKVNPQKLIINGTDSVKLTDSGQQTQDDEGTKSLGIGAFILITLLATAVNIVGIITFLSVGLIFVARVIGLWFAMILSPFVFFSYTVPALQDMEMVGWKKWWPETLKLAFLAPVFIFFMYLIIAFLQTGLSLVKANETTDGMTFVISIIVPFIFIMILLMKSKDIAKDMSGKMGQSITNGIAAAGSMALGGAALGAAALGRGLISNPMKMMQSSESTRNAALKNFNVLKPSTYGKAVSAKMANVGLKTKVGDEFNKKITEIKKGQGDKAHATHLLDEQADKIKKGAKYSDLDSGQQSKAKEKLQREELSKFIFDGKSSDKLDAVERDTLNKALKLNESDLNKFIKKINKDPNKFHNSEHLESEYNKKDIGFIDKSKLNMATGSYDIRNAKMDGLLAPVKATMKLGLKGLGMSVGKAQGDFMKDLGATLKDAIKNIKIDVKVDSHGGGDAHASAGHDSHGGGHDAHGGGGHH